jgi:phenylacetate-CoA ligase
MAVSEYFDALETMSAESREKYLAGNLKRTLSHAYRYSTTARKIFSQAGVVPGDIRNFADLQKLPISRKTDVIEWQKRDPPYGGLLTISLEKIERVFISPGPIYEPQQTAKVEWFGKALFAAGFRKGDVVINSFTYHMSPAGILMHEGLRRCGASVIPAGIGNTDIQIQAMRDLKATGYIGTPSFLHTLIKRIEEMGLSLNRDFALKRAWFTGEMLSPTLRTLFESDYGLDTAQAYAVTEPGGAIAYECSLHNGMHLMDDYVIEIVDPTNGKQLNPGEVGEIVVTPIHNPIWGLIRFGTGDLSSFLPGGCDCGRTAKRLSGILGRAGDAVKVRGMFIVGKQAEQIIAGLPEIAKFQLVIFREAERDGIILKVELKTGNEGGKPNLLVKLSKQFQDICRVKLDKIELLSPGSLPENCQKLSDQRVWK